MCKTTRRRPTTAVLPTPGAPTTPGSPTSPATLSQIPPNQAPATGTSTVTVMPPPANDNETKDLREVTFPLFRASGTPALEEVKQSPSLANCPVAAILAAHAFTSAGQTRIRVMITTTTGPVLTDISAVKNELANPPEGDTIPSNRFFTVTLPNGPREVSDVFYTDDGDSVFFLRYLNDPTDGSLWGAVIEKALAVELGSYENFDALNLTANEFWERITGVPPAGFSITATTPSNDILNAAQRSETVPTIAASRDDLPITGHIVSPDHGYAMIGIKDGKIHLYNPAKTEKIVLTPAEFRDNFEAILHAPP